MKRPVVASCRCQWPSLASSRKRVSLALKAAGGNSRCAGQAPRGARRCRSRARCSCHGWGLSCCSGRAAGRCRAGDGVRCRQAGGGMAASSAAQSAVGLRLALSGVLPGGVGAVGAGVRPVVSGVVGVLPEMFGASGRRVSVADGGVPACGSWPDAACPPQATRPRPSRLAMASWAARVAPVCRGVRRGVRRGVPGVWSWAVHSAVRAWTVMDEVGRSAFFIGRFLQERPGRWSFCWRGVAVRKVAGRRYLR